MDEEVIAELMDLADLTEGQATGILRWHEQRLTQERMTWGGMAIVRLLGWILDGQTNADMRLRVLGTAFGLGLGHLTQYKSQEDVANAFGTSAMAVSDMGSRARKAIHPQ